MDSDSLSDRLASASRRYQLDFLSRSGELKKKKICVDFSFPFLFFDNSFDLRFDLVA